MSLTRSVHRLAITAPSATVARRAALLVEDALRTASLPGDDAELVLVRRLDLPQFNTRASAQGVALRLESACRALAPVSGRDADDTRLAAALAVRFADGLEAQLALTARLLGGRPARAWCWALAVPGYRPDAGPRAGLRSVALSLVQGEAAAAALPHWFAQVLAWGGIERVLLALDAADAALIAQHFPPSGPPRVAAEARHAHAWQRAQAWAAQCLADDDPRRVLLESMAARLVWAPAARDVGSTTPRPARARRVATHRHGRQAAGLEEGTTLRAQAGNAASPAESTRPDPATTAGAPQLHHTPVADDPSAPFDPAAAPGTGASPPRPPHPDSGLAADVARRGPHWRVLPARDGTPADVLTADAPTADAPTAYRAVAAVTRPSAAVRAALRTTPPSDGDGPPPAAGESRADARPASRPAPEVDMNHPPDPVRADNLPRPAAGWLAPPHAIDAPTRAGGLLFLLPVLERVGLPAWLVAHPADGSELPAQILAQLLLRLRVADDDPAWALGRVAPAAEAQRHASHWLAACRRHLRLAAGIAPASLCLRPAQMVITPTHADVWLAFAQLDLRIRRAGLDIDPGWVPWFGRVVRFHYGQRSP